MSRQMKVLSKSSQRWRRVWEPLKVAKKREEAGNLDNTRPGAVEGSSRSRWWSVDEEDEEEVGEMVVSAETSRKGAEVSSWIGRRGDERAVSWTSSSSESSSSSAMLNLGSRSSSIFWPASCSRSCGEALIRSY